MRRNSVVFRRDEIGMPDAHAEKFVEVAKAQRVVIISRAVGPTCLQLLEEGYDTKGFRIHGKSCNWGPMAGFVMRDPRLNKAALEKEEYNRKEHRTALRDTSHSGWRASTTPLKITQARIDWLLRTGRIALSAMGSDLCTGFANHAGVHFHYILRKQQTTEGEVWRVELDNSKSQFRQEKGRGYFSTRWGWIGRSGRRPRYEPLMAMTNPPEHRAYPEGDHRNAITGDYDLFAVWPRTGEYEAEGLDRRVLGTVRVLTHQAEIDRMEADFVAGIRQGTKLGNMTDRIYLVSQLLNSAIATAWTRNGMGGWRQNDRRQVCWHSTESARPYVNDVDLPIVAFLPEPGGPVLELGIETIDDFKQLIDLTLAYDYRPLLAEGWVLDPDPAKPEKKRLGQQWAHLVPADSPGGQQKVPNWYNR